MDSIDLDILKFMSERENYNAYRATITQPLCTKESWLLVGDMGRYFDDNPTIDSIGDDFKLWFRVTGHPGWKPEEHKIYGTIMDNVFKRPAPNRLTFLAQLERVRFTSEVSQHCRDLREGSINPLDFIAKVDKTTKTLASRTSAPMDEYSLDNIAKHQRTTPGLYHRLEDLNKSIGPLRKGDFVVIAKRPEVGGTSFLCSEMSYMIEQLPEKANAILFNNEEEPTKVYTRMVGAALGVDYRTMMTAHALHQQKYDQWLDGRTWELKHDTNMTIGSMHTKLKEREYGLIGINVLLKVGGTDAKEDHDKFQALGEECRRIAQQYGPVLAIVQADPSAEGLRYIPQDRIYKSKTALQGEADALIMIGQDHDEPDDVRYINVAKNKVPPAACTDVAFKHIKSEVHFDLGTGRFTSKNFKGNSRDVQRLHTNDNVVSI